MKFQSQVFSAIVLIWTSPVLGHQAPHGDGRPSIYIEGGKFALYFSSQDQGITSSERSPYRIIYEPDGTVILPRHRVLFDMTKYHKIPPHSYPWQGPVKIHAIEGSELSRFSLSTQINGSDVDLPLPIEPAKQPQIDERTVLADRVAFSWASRKTLGELGSDLMFSACLTRGFTPGLTVRLGKPAMIYDFPTSSAPIWAAGRWWLAWVSEAETEEERKDPLRAWQTILSSIDPLTHKVEYKKLQGLSSWNTGVDLKTTGGWLCIAWNASIDGSYPGIAKVVTAFERLPTP